MNFNEKFNNLLNNSKAVTWLIVSAIVGVLIMIIPFNSGRQASETKQENDKEIIDTSNVKFSSDLEKKLENILSKISGVGEVNVLIVYSSSYEDVVLKDKDADGSEKTVFKTNSSQNSPYITKLNYPEISGVIIVADGGDKNEIKTALSDAVSSTLAIPIHKVKIFERRINNVYGS